MLCPWVNSAAISVHARKTLHVKYVYMYHCFQCNLGSVCYFILEKATELGAFTVLFWNSQILSRWNAQFLLSLMRPITFILLQVKWLTSEWTETHTRIHILIFSFENGIFKGVCLILKNNFTVSKMFFWDKYVTQKYYFYGYTQEKWHVHKPTCTVIF